MSCPRACASVAFRNLGGMRASLQFDAGASEDDLVRHKDGMPSVAYLFYGMSLSNGNKHCLCYRKSASSILVRSLVLEARDRKSVVSGKSVSVRVDLGGSRIITK